VTSMLDLDAIRSCQQKTWVSGNYAAADPARIHAVSERPARRGRPVVRHVRAGRRDGNRQHAIAAACRAALVTALGHVPDLPRQARARSAAAQDCNM
jgi:hypothetical protein